MLIWRSLLMLTEDRNSGSLHVEWIGLVFLALQPFSSWELYREQHNPNCAHFGKWLFLGA